MDPIILASIAMVFVIVMLVFRVPISFTLGCVSTLGLFLFFSWRPDSDFNAVAGIAPTLSLIGNTTFGFIHNYPLSMIPLFIGLGHIAYQAGITTDLYYAMRFFLSKLPGGLAMASVVGCGGFSAITGSSVACASAMGRISVPEMLGAGYSKELSTGSVAVGGTLGSLIPPSILFVIYATFTEQSVKSLFLAGIIPGLLSLFGFLLSIYIWVKLRPEIAPKYDATDLSVKERNSALLKVWPAVLILTTIVIGIYWGIFTPTEAAAISMAMAIAIGLFRRRLNWANLALSLRETVLQTTAIFMIAVGAKIFVTFFALTRVEPTMVSWIEGLGVTPWVIIGAIVIFYLILGTFLDSIGILVLTLPFTVPLVESYGLDLIWFGVVVIKLLEIGLITPPVGLNVFIIKAVSPPEISLNNVYKGIVAFLLIDFLVLLAIILIPDLSLLIPRLAR